MMSHARGGCWHCGIEVDAYEVIGSESGKMEVRTEGSTGVGDDGARLRGGHDKGACLGEVVNGHGLQGNFWPEILAA
jgi:hypothetical protein